MLKVQLKAPQAWFIQQLNHQSFNAVHKATVEKFGDKWTEPGNIQTYGAYRLTSWKHDASLTLTKEPRWHGAKSVKVNKVELIIITDAVTAENAYKAGNADANETDLAPASVPSWIKNPEYKTNGTIGTYYYGFNVKNIPDVNQRRAMAFAIDRKAIIRFVTKGGQFPAKGFTPNRAPGSKEILKNATMPATAKLAQAKALMAKVKNPKRNINLYFNTSTGHAAIATAVQAFWKELGITTNLKNMEFGQYLQFLGPPPNSDVDVYRLGWIYDYPDAYNGFELWKCDSGNNNTNWCNRKYDAIVEQGGKDAERRRSLQAVPAGGDDPHRPERPAADHADLLVRLPFPGQAVRAGIRDQPHRLGQLRGSVAQVGGKSSRRVRTGRGQRPVRTLRKGARPSMPRF